jgi:hypothetical protein
LGVTLLVVIKTGGLLASINFMKKKIIIPSIFPVNKKASHTHLESTSSSPFILERNNGGVPVSLFIL